MSIKKILFVLTLVFIKTISFGQTITMYNSKSKNDIEITNGRYHLYFKKVDFVNVIEKVDKLLKTENKRLIELINKNNFSKAIDIKSEDEKEKKLLELLKNNIGVYLLLKGKATILKDNKIVTQIVADEAPEMVDLNGETTRRIFFAEKDSEIEIFLGDMTKKLGAE